MIDLLNKANILIQNEGIYCLVENIEELNNDYYLVKLKNSHGSLLENQVKKSKLDSIAPIENAKIKELFKKKNFKDTSIKILVIEKNNLPELQVEDVIAGITDSIYGYDINESDFNEYEAFIYHNLIKALLDFKIVSIDTFKPAINLPSKQELIYLLLASYNDVITLEDKCSIAIKVLLQLSKEYLKANLRSYKNDQCDYFIKHFKQCM